MMARFKCYLDALFSPHQLKKHCQSWTPSDKISRTTPTINKRTTQTCFLFKITEPRALSIGKRL